MEFERLIKTENPPIPVFRNDYSSQKSETSGDFALNIKTVAQRKREHYNSKLLDAVKEGSVNECIRLIEEGKADVNCECRQNGATPIMVATAWGYFDIVEELITLGADILQRDSKNRTAIHVAAAEGYLDILRLFFQGREKHHVERIANIRIINEIDEQKELSFDSWVHKHGDLLPSQMPDLQEGSTPLHAASQWSRSPCVRFLLEIGADSSLLDNRGLTALDVAGEKKVVSQSNARTHATTTPDQPLSPSSGKEELNLIRSMGLMGRIHSEPEMLSDSVESDEETDDTSSSISHSPPHAKLSSAKDTLSKIFKKGGFLKNVENPVQDEEDETTDAVILLLFEKWRRSMEILPIESIKRRPIRTSNIQKPMTCLHTAVSSGNMNLLKSILLNNDKIEQTLHVFDKDGLTPLHRAVFMRRLDIIKVILENGMKHLININDFGGRTLLFICVELEWNEGIDYFLNNGAELSLSSQDNSNVLHVAARLGNAHLLSELVQSDRGITLVNSTNNKHMTPLWLAVKKSSEDCVSLLLLAGAEVTPSRPNHRNLLHLAAENPSPGTLKLLLQHGGYSLISDRFEGMTPLHFACRKGLVDCVRVLVEYGCDVRDKTGAVGDFTSGGTCLHLAARFGHLKVVEYLLHIDKCLLDIPNDDNWCPLHVAARCGYSDCAQLLIAKGADLSIQVIDRSGNKNTAFDLISSFIPQPYKFFQTILDDSIEMNGLPADHAFCQIKFKYHIFINPDKYKRQLKALVTLTNIRNEALLEKTILHPLIRTFLFLKWQKLKFFFMVVVMLYVTFTVSFTAKSMAMLGGDQDVLQNSTVSFQKYMWRTLNDSILSQSAMPVYKSLVIASLLLIAPMELYQALYLRQYYFYDVESWLRVTIMILSVWSFALEADARTLTHSIAAIVILCSWAQLLFLFARLPDWGFGILMFCKVAQNVLKVLVTFSCLILGFTFAFMMLFQSSQSFSTFWLALLKIMVMMSEFDYADLFSEREGQDYLARAVFLAFLILVSIVMMNLMVGMAVSDIALLEDQGRASRLVKQIDFLDLLEVLVYNDCLLKVLPRKVGIKLKKMRAVPREFIFSPIKRFGNKTDFPSNLLTSISGKIDELNKRSSTFNGACPGNLREDSNSDKKANDLLIGDSTILPSDETIDINMKLQCVLEELSRLKDELRSLKEHS